jgi:hypothetical protein
MSSYTNSPNQSDLIIDAAALISAMRSPKRLEKLLERYRRHGFTDREIVAAMAASPRLVNPLGKGR